MDVVVERFDIYVVRIASPAENAVTYSLIRWLKARESGNLPAMIVRPNLVSMALPVGINPQKKTQLCVVVSPGEINRHLKSVIVAPMTTQSKPYPTRVACHLDGKDGYILLDQIRAVHKRYLEKKVGQIGEAEARQVLAVLGEMFAE